jgi:putative NADH-flavin reductase
LVDLEACVKLAIVAATGGVGEQVLRQAAPEHEVTAIVRDPSRLPVSVPAVAVDLSAADPAALAEALEGADAVLSCLGPRSTSDAGIVARGTQAIIQAMQATQVTRIVAISAAPVGVVASPGRPRPPKHDPGDGPVIRFLLGPLLRAVLRENYADLAVMEDLLRGSGLAWTVLRPPRLTNGSSTGVYRTAYGQNVRGGLRISRADVAHLMLRVIDQPQAIRQTVAVAY